jgi:hypothetical protein
MSMLVRIVNLNAREQVSRAFFFDSLDSEIVING